MAAAETIPSAAQLTGEPRPAPSTLRIAYLLSRYPAISHTFFLHEVLGLRARGLEIETASINVPDRPIESLSPDEAAEARRTFYVKGESKMRIVSELIAAAIFSPAALLRGLAAVLAVPRLTVPRRILWLFYLAEAMLVGRWMRQRKLMHLHVHFGGPVASVGMLVARAWKIPFSLTIHGPEELLNHEAYHLREKLDAASFVLCISDFCRSQLCQLTPPEDWAKFKVVRLGVDPLVLAPERGASALAGGYEPEHVVKIVATGRLAPQKGHRILLEALLLLRDRGLCVHTTIIGGGPEREMLEAFVARHELGDRVVFTGALAHAETLDQLRRADLFALASFGEGIPVALMEAMSLRIPCVTTSIAGIPELIRDGVEGLLVPPANKAQFADALSRLVVNAPLRRQLGASARERILTLYNLPMNHELLAQTFSQELRLESAARERFA